MFVKFAEHEQECYEPYEAAEKLSPYKIGDKITLKREFHSGEGYFASGTEFEVIKVSPAPRFMYELSHIPIGKENDYIAEPSAFCYTLRDTDDKEEQRIVECGYAHSDYEITEPQSPKREKLFKKCSRKIALWKAVSLFLPVGFVTAFFLTSNLFYLIPDLILVPLCGFVLLCWSDTVKYRLDRDCTFYKKDTEGSFSFYKALFDNDDPWITPF